MDEMLKIFSTICLISIIAGSCDTYTPRVAEPAGTPVVGNTPSEVPVREARSFDPQRDIGSIAYGDKCQRLRILNDALIPGDPVQIVRIERPQETRLAKIVVPVDCPESKQSPMGEFGIDSDSDKGIVEYQVEFADKGNEVDIHLGIAIVNSPGKVAVKSGVAELDHPGEAPLYFRDCTSNEGLHLTVWAGKPLVGKRIWHAYQHFLYDTEPSCRDEEVSDLYESDL